MPQGGRATLRGRSFVWWVLGACAAGLVLRLVYALVVKAGAPFHGDAFYYHGQAQLNLEGYWFVNPSVIGAKHHAPALVASAQHPPVFTLLLTAADLVGIDRLGSQLTLVCVIGTGTVALTALVVRDLAGSGPARSPRWSQPFTRGSGSSTVR